MATLTLTTKYTVRVKQYTYRIDANYDTIADAQTVIDARDNPADWFIQPEIVYVITP